MTRPEAVRCENCCYFEPFCPHPKTDAVMEGYCIRLPPVLLPGPDESFPDGPPVHSALRRTHGRMGCGEFRETWPRRNRAGLDDLASGLNSIEHMLENIEQAIGNIR